MELSYFRDVNTSNTRAIFIRSKVNGKRNRNSGEILGARCGGPVRGKCLACRKNVRRSGFVQMFQRQRHEIDNQNLRTLECITKRSNIPKFISKIEEKLWNLFKKIVTAYYAIYYNELHYLSYLFSSCTIL